VSEPAADQGAIQPIGFLIALSGDWMVDHASANVTEFAGKPIDETIGQHVNSLLCPDVVHALRNRLALRRDPDAVERLLRCALFADERLFDVSLHMSEGCVIVEAEPSSEQHYGDITGTVRGMIGRLDHARDLPAFLEEGARQVRALTGFDRVTISRFATDGSGQVVAESARGGTDSLLGRHFPPSGTPHQPGGPHNRTMIRVITDVEAAPVPIIPGLDEQPLDLSLSVLRSVSPQNIVYLRTIGVRASMSITIIVEDQPWGLIVCHHSSPRCPSFERRSIAELFAQMLSMRLEIRELKEMLEAERRECAGSN
jgi:light-regulated signal transduction histidine kinase (bacteriophytochrome)